MCRDRLGEAFGLLTPPSRSSRQSQPFANLRRYKFKYSRLIPPEARNRKARRVAYRRAVCVDLLRIGWRIATPVAVPGAHAPNARVALCVVLADARRTGQ